MRAGQRNSFGALSVFSWFSLFFLEFSGFRETRGDSEVAISLGCHRIQNPLKSGNTKKIHIQNHPFPVWPRKYEKKTEKLQKWSLSGQFCNFSVFFRIFGAKPEMGDFVIFCIFFVFPDLRGFCILWHPREIATLRGV